MYGAYGVPERNENLIYRSVNKLHGHVTMLEPSLPLLLLISISSINDSD